MAERRTHSLITVSVIAVAMLCLWPAEATRTGNVGVSYGMMVSDLPAATTVVDLLRRNGISRLRIYNGNEEVLGALRNTGIRTVIGVMNEELSQVSQDPTAAMDWIKRHVLAFYPATKITHISVGNEVFINKQFLPYLLPAMQNIQSAVDAAGLRGKIKVSTAHPDSVITDFYPPSKAEFDADIKEDMTKVVEFLRENQSPFMVHIHPYFAHTRSHGFVSLDYALFGSNRVVVPDVNFVTGKRKGYWNVFDAIRDSLVASMARVGVRGVPILVLETGWPTAGGPAASVQNAWIYNNRFIQHAAARNMTAFLFSLYNEDRTLSRFDPTESHFGIFRPESSTPFYPIRF